jgi:putative transposase
MTRGLIRYQHRKDFHFVTFSCYQRKAYLASPSTRALFEDALEKMRVRYGFSVAGYVVMPEHVHLLVSEPEAGVLADALKGLKLSVALRSVERPFWSARYYDFNVFTEKKRWRLSRSGRLHGGIVAGWKPTSENPDVGHLVLWWIEI